MPLRAVSVFLISALAALLAACAPQTEVVKLYEDRRAVGTLYKRLLVVDVSPDKSQRVDFESELVATLKKQQVEAIPSSTRLDESDDLRQEAIDRLSREVDADAILITHIASVDTKTEIEEGREEIISTCRGGDPYEYFLYDHEVLKQPESVKFAHTVVVISNLYDAISRKRVWTIQSTCFEKSSMREVMIDEARAIARQLRIDEFV